ncbi:MAG: acetyl-CoA carboxylase biotin carboxyl carrier protein [Puniceicoccales bacterium]|nr:acetyl-CoA carboxylase biotin carboxyl carrier protein [Puniceicoccales bacterium]
MNLKEIISDIKDLAEVVKTSGLAEVEIEKNGIRLRISNGGARALGPNVLAAPNQLESTPNYAVPAPVDSANGCQKREAVDAEDVVLIKSPMVGTFYSASSPDAPNYVEVNSEVDSNTVVCIIEAMKVMNEIQADARGIVVDIFAKNGQTVEYGQPLFKVKKS